MSTVTTETLLRESVPRWVAPVWELREGRDPLGMQTTTTDRLLPVLLPGLIELSQQARYFSFYAHLLAEYERRKLGSSRSELDRFVRRAEWDYGLAVLRCERCDTSPQGSQRLRPIIHEHEETVHYPRGLSVQTTLGGYGLYYRAPMNELGLIAREGSLLGDEPIPIDVLARTDRAERLAVAFTTAVEDTAYHRDGWIVRTEPLPRGVVEEYGRVGCLCRLGEFADERDAVEDALFGRDAPLPVEGSAIASAGVPQTPDPDGSPPIPRPDAEGTVIDAVVQRGRSVAHFLTLLDDDAEVVSSQSAYRRALWDSAGSRSEAHRRVAGQWAGLVVKDVWQEAVCSVWTSFCRDGLARHRELGRPLEPSEVEAVARGMVAAPPTLDAEQATGGLAAALAGGQLSVAMPANVVTSDGQAVDAVTVAPSSLTMEQLRRATVALDSASFGLIVLLELARRIEQRSGPGWAEAVSVGSGWQPSVAEVVAVLERHLQQGPTVADTLWWVTRRFVLPVHERIAYSKLPQRMFTFRFRWEDSRLRFYDHGIDRFPLAAARHTPFVQLTSALGMWVRRPNEPAELTARGRSFIAAHLGP